MSNHKPKTNVTVVIDLSSEKGNIFSIMGIVRNELLKHGHAQLSSNFLGEITQASSYEHALEIVRKYVNLE